MTTKTYDNKPAFDPNKPFEAIEEKPAFDPNKPFEAVKKKKVAVPSYSQVERFQKRVKDFLLRIKEIRGRW